MPSSRRCAQVLRTSLSAAVPVCGLCISTSHQSVLCCAVCAHKHKHRLPAKPPSAAAYTLTDFHGQATSEQYLVMQPPGEPNSTQSSETRAACTFTRHMKNLCVCVCPGWAVGGWWGCVLWCCTHLGVLLHSCTARAPHTAAWRTIAQHTAYGTMRGLNQRIKLLSLRLQTLPLETTSNRSAPHHTASASSTAPNTHTRDADSNNPYRAACLAVQRIHTRPVHRQPVEPCEEYGATNPSLGVTPPAAHAAASVPAAPPCQPPSLHSSHHTLLLVACWPRVYTGPAHSATP